MKTVYERDGGWYWCDESWAEHGPYATRDDAKFLQKLYVAWYLEGEPPPSDPAVYERAAKLGVSLEGWRS